MGKRENLYGDDFDHDQISKWFHEERTAYHELPKSPVSVVKYKYYNRNHFYWGEVVEGLASDDKVLIFGSALGSEVSRYNIKSNQLTLIDSDFDTLCASKPDSSTKIAASESGDIELPNESFDLILCLGVLHHIPNVSHVLDELTRLLKSSGSLIIREPVVKMGDPKTTRPGLTPNERGIPHDFFLQYFKTKNLLLSKSGFMGFAALGWLSRKLGINLDSPLMVRLDSILCSMTWILLDYEQSTIRSRLAPTSAYYIIEKNIG